jgi:GNAT superfamily N-acetyltransferase
MRLDYMTMPDFRYLENDAQLRDAFALMTELRPHLAGGATFAEQIGRQRQAGYRLLGEWQQDVLVGLVGFRLLENLLYGRFIYVDDLVVAASERKRGIGASLLDAVRQEAARQGCGYLVLDTGLHMPLAQRFYFREGLLATGMHFTQAVASELSRHV